jgi:hypothetical protein
MIAMAMIALLVAAAPVQQEELESFNEIENEIVLNEEELEDENAISDEESGEIVFEDEVVVSEDQCEE